MKIQHFESRQGKITPDLASRRAPRCSKRTSLGVGSTSQLFHLLPRLAGSLGRIQHAPGRLSETAVVAVGEGAAHFQVADLLLKAAGGSAVIASAPDATTFQLRHHRSKRKGAGCQRRLPPGRAFRLYKAHLAEEDPHRGSPIALTQVGLLDRLYRACHECDSSSAFWPGLFSRKER